MKWIFSILAEADAFSWCFPKQAIDRLWNPSIWREKAETTKYYGWLKLVKISSFGKKKSTKLLIIDENLYACDKLWRFYGSEGLYIVISLIWAPQAVRIIQFFIFSFFGVCFEPKFDFRRGFEVIFFHCGWSWSFLMMFSQTSNWQTLKFFNLKGKRWEKKIIRMAEIGQNIQFWQKSQQSSW